jgi:DNA-binding IclR family transcriptional regulator
MATRVPALERAHGILSFMAANPRTSFTVSELSEGTGINRATSFATVVALTQLGLLHRDRHKRYTLGAELAALGDAASAQYDGYRPARVEMFRLARDLHVSAMIVARAGDALMVTLDYVGTHEHPSGSRLGVGAINHMQPPIGTIFMAWESPNAIDDWLGRTMPDATQEELQAHRDTLQAVRCRGYSVGGENEAQYEVAQLLQRLAAAATDGERQALTVTIGRLLRLAPAAAALPDGPRNINLIIGPAFGPNGRVALSITVWGAPGQMTTDNLDHYIRPLLASANRITSATGGYPPPATTRDAEPLAAPRRSPARPRPKQIADPARADS